MTRVLVIVQKDRDNFLLRRAEGENVGEIVQTIKPGESFSVGNSIGGYYARPVNYANQPALALVRLSGSEKDLPLERVKKIAKGRRGEIMLPGRIGLWATTSGSARRGLFHRPGDPIKKALASSSIAEEVVESINKEVEVWGSGNFDFLSDCKEEIISFASTEPGVVRLYGGTFVISYRYSLDSSNQATAIITKVVTTPKADRLKVSYKIKSLSEPFQMPDTKYVYVIRTLDNGEHFCVYVPIFFAEETGQLRVEASPYSYDGLHRECCIPSFCWPNPKEWGKTGTPPLEWYQEIEGRNFATLLKSKGLQVRTITEAPDDFANAWGATGYSEIPKEFLTKNLHRTHCPLKSGDKWVAAAL